MVRLRLLSFLLTLGFVALVGFSVSLLARGYRLDLKQFDLLPAGLLVVTSQPDGAQILINNELESATNATISLVPQIYDVEVRREGFLPWQKRLTIKKEEVTKAEVVLFPAAPSLSALTFSGALKPMLSPDRTKIAYGVPQGQTQDREPRVGIWIMDMSDLPIGFSRDPRQVTDANPEIFNWQWSPDSRQLLLTTLNRDAYLVNSGFMTAQNKLVNIAGERLTTLFDQWEEEEDKRLKPKIARLPDQMQDIITRKTDQFAFSPDDNKILYTASGSAQIAENLISSLPGSSTQKQDRNIEGGSTYVYDIKEDRNFLIDSEELEIGNWKLENSIRRLVWFPTSNHLILAEESKITIMDYDGTNRQVVWGGPYESPYAIPFPNSTRLLILTSLGASNGTSTNLYSLSLR